MPPAPVELAPTHFAGARLVVHSPFGVVMTTGVFPGAPTSCQGAAPATPVFKLIEAPCTLAAIPARKKRKRGSVKDLQ